MPRSHSTGSGSGEPGRCIGQCRMPVVGSSLGANFAAGSAWSPGDWDAVQVYADKAWHRAGYGFEEAWKGRWLNAARKRAQSILREQKSVRASVAVGVVLYERGTLDGGQAVPIMEAA
jgi:hypothetical protein